MRTWLKWMLFGNSYTPLFVLLLIKDFDSSAYVGKWSPGHAVGTLTQTFQTPQLSWTLVALIIASNVTLWKFFRAAKLVAPETLAVTRSYVKSSESLNYIVTYVIPFLSFDLSSSRDLASLVIVLLVMALLYVNSNLLYTNPMLSMFGYTVYGVELAESSIVLVTKYSRPKKDDRRQGVHLTDDIYLEV